MQKNNKGKDAYGKGKITSTIFSKRGNYERAGKALAVKSDCMDAVKCV